MWLILFCCLCEAICIFLACCLALVPSLAQLRSWWAVYQQQSGVLFGIGAMLGFGVEYFLLSLATAHLDPVHPVMISRLCSALLFFASARQQRIQGWGEIKLKHLGLIALIGLLDVLGTVSYFCGSVVVSGAYQRCSVGRSQYHDRWYDRFIALRKVRYIFMAVAFSKPVEVSPFLTKRDMTLLKQEIWLLLLFFLCLEIGCLLLLPFGPSFRQSSLPFRQWLLPLVFIWWGIVTPVWSYWLFQRFVSCWQNRPLSHPARTEGHVPVTLHLSLAELEIRRQRSRDREQRRHYQTLALAARGYTIEKMVALMGMDEESIAALIFIQLQYLGAASAAHALKTVSPAHCTAFARWYLSAKDSENLNGCISIRENRRSERKVCISSNGVKKHGCSWLIDVKAARRSVFSDAQAVAGFG